MKRRKSLDFSLVLLKMSMAWPGSASLEHFLLKMKMEENLHMETASVTMHLCHPHIDPNILSCVWTHFSALYKFGPPVQVNQAYVLWLTVALQDCCVVSALSFLRSPNKHSVTWVWVNLHMTYSVRIIFCPKGGWKKHILHGRKWTNAHLAGI